MQTISTYPIDEWDDDTRLCRDYQCCHLRLPDLHALLQHYEDHHHTPSSVDVPETALQDLTSVAMHRRSVQFDTGEDVASVGIRPGVYQSRRRPRPLDLHYTSDDDEDAFVVAEEGEACIGVSPTLLQVAEAHGTKVTLPEPMVVHVVETPVSTTPATPAEPVVEEGEAWKTVMATLTAALSRQVSRAHSDDGVVSPAPIALEPSVAAAILTSTLPPLAPAKRRNPKDPFSPLESSKPYRCMVPGCDKAYKNPNGLKYHNVHGHSALAMQLGVHDDGLGNRSKRYKMTPPGSPGAKDVVGGIDTPASTVPNSPKGSTDDMHRPYKCPLPGCGKAYKNVNGLKYHTEHAHPHGAVGVPAGRKARARWEWERRAEWVRKELESRLLQVTGGNATEEGLEKWLKAVASATAAHGMRREGVDEGRRRKEEDAKWKGWATAPQTPVGSQTPAGSQSPILGAFQF